MYLKTIETIGHISLSDSSHYSDSKDDDWILNTASQSALDVSDVDFNGMFRKPAVKIPVNYIYLYDNM